MRSEDGAGDGIVQPTKEKWERETNPEPCGSLVDPADDDRDPLMKIVWDKRLGTTETFVKQVHSRDFC